MYKNDNTEISIKYRFEQLLSGIYARWVCENNKQVCMDCLKPRSNINTFYFKKCGFPKFYVFDYQNSSFVLLFSLKWMKWKYSQKSNFILMQ